MANPVYLVTGGCGFIGSHLVDRLLNAGCRVRVLDDLSTGRRENLAPQADLTVGDVTHAATLERALDGVDGCFHLAAVASVARCNDDGPGTHAVNQSAAVSLFELARPDSLDIPVVYASSAAVYGHATNLPIGERGPLDPVSAYGADKLGCELHARAGATVHGLRAMGLRFFNVFGPRQDPTSPYSGVISIFADRLARGLPITIFGDGEQSRDFIYVADVVEFLVRAMERTGATSRTGGHAEVFNVCTGRATSVCELARTLGRLVHRRPEIRHATAREGDIRHSRGAPGAAEAALGHRAVFGLDDGLARLLDRMEVLT